IETPDAIKIKEPRKNTIRRFYILAAIIPALVIIGAWTGSKFHENLARVNPKVQLAQDILEINSKAVIQSDISEEESIEIDAFRTSGKSEQELFIEANDILGEFHIGGMWLGGFIGLVFGLTLASLSIFRYREDYEPNKGTCLSCARCMDYCPVEPIELSKKIKSLET
ncbi:MAG: hypothetical protein GQ527_01075, partial [Bacteroidales bacterium]|nr:hypothetical protein [Bacteroidales bacterium]